MPSPFDLPQFGDTKKRNTFDLPQFSGAKISDTNPVETKYIEAKRAEANAAQAQAHEASSVGGFFQNFSNAMSSIGDLGKSIIQGTARSAATVLNTVGQAMPKGKNPPRPKSDFAKRLDEALLGPGEVKTIPKLVQETAPTVKSFIPQRTNLSPFEQKLENIKAGAVATPIVVGQVVMDLYFGGGAEEKGFKAAVSNIAESESKSAVLGMLKQYFPKFKPDTATLHDLAGILAKEKNPQKVAYHLFDAGALPAEKAAGNYTRLVSKREIQTLKETGALPSNKEGYINLIKPGKEAAIKGIPETKTHRITFNPSVENRIESHAGPQAAVKGTIPKTDILKIEPINQGRTLLGRFDVKKPLPTSAYGALAGVEIKKDEQGNTKLGFNPIKATLGVAGIAAFNKIRGMNPDSERALMQTVTSIAGEKDSGRIFNMLQNQFPSLGKAEAEVISKHLVSAADENQVVRVLDKAGVFDLKTLREKVGNIRLDKFDLPPASRDELAKVIQDSEGFVKQRRGIQTFADTEALAQGVKLPKNLKPGKALNAEELQALGGHIAATRTQLDDISKRVALGANTDMDLLKQAELQQKTAALLSSYAGATAEAGRSLSILRNIRQAIDTGDTTLIKKAMEVVGGRDKIEQVAAHLAAFDPEDKIGKYNYIRSLNKPGATDWANWYFYTNLLSGPKTHVRNILGNSSSLVANTLSKPFASTADYLRHFVTGKEREVFAGEIPASLHGMIAGIKDGWQKALFTLKNGYTLDDLAKLDFKPPEVKGGIYTNLVSRSLEGADQFFRSINATAELHSLAFSAAKKKGLTGSEFKDFYTEFVQNPPVSAIKQVSREASRAIFRQETDKFSQALVKLKSDFHITINGKEHTLFNPMKFALPFVSTPYNIIKSSLEHTPVGFFTGFLKDTAREQNQALGRAAFGSVALAPLAIMASEGKISGSGPKDPELRDLLYRQGWQPNSIRIGDKWYNYSNFQPLALPLSLIANSFEEWHYEGKQADVGTVLAKTANSVLQQSYLSGLSALQNALEDPQAYGKAFVNKILVSGVPLSSFFGQLTRAQDTTVRQATTAKEAVQAIIPGQSQKLQPRTNALGEEATRKTGLSKGVEFLSNFLSPVDIRTVQETPLGNDLTRLSKDIPLSRPSKTFTINNKKIEYTPEEYTALIKNSGSAIRQRLEKISQTEAWQKAPDEKKAKFIKKVVDDEREKAKKQLIRSTPRLLQAVRSK